MYTVTEPVRFPSIVTCLKDLYKHNGTRVYCDKYTGMANRANQVCFISSKKPGRCYFSWFSLVCALASFRKIYMKLVSYATDALYVFLFLSVAQQSLYIFTHTPYTHTQTHTYIHSFTQFQHNFSPFFVVQH